MDILARARALEAQGRSVIHLEIGEPDFPTPPPVIEAAKEALARADLHYTTALGLPALRESIARYYPAAHRPRPDCVAITPGASGALQLALAAVLDAGDEVLLPDPGYPCTRNMVRLLGAVPRLLPVDAEAGYQLVPETVERHLGPRTRALILASPANPTGAVIPLPLLAELVRRVEAHGGYVIVDEIYHGLVYGAPVASALTCSERVIVINSFSKYYGMTGWRIGWLVAPPPLMPVIDRLAQNLFLAPNTPGQHAALAALAPETGTELERRRDEFKVRRDFLVPALRALGFRVPVGPEGAFYVYADCGALTDDSDALAYALLEETGVAVTPGRDFGEHRAKEHLRFSYANTLANLQEAVARLGAYVG